MPEDIHNQNPYETPSARPLQKESRRELWQKRLICPHCQQPGITAGIAYLAHPLLKVRCEFCQRQLRVSLHGEAQRRVNFVWGAAIITGVWGIAFLYITPAPLINSLLSRWFPRIWDSVERTTGPDGRLRIVIAGMGLITLLPLLSVLAFAIRICLRDIAYHAMLVPEKNYKAACDESQDSPSDTATSK